MFIIRYLGKLTSQMIFTAIFLIAIQLPVFIDLYTQRISGHYDENQHQINQFQQIADTVFNGDLQLLMAHYQKNSDEVIVKTGGLISDLLIRSAQLTKMLNHLHSTSYPEKLFYFFKEIDYPVAKKVIAEFKPALPFNIDALVIGFIFAVLISGLLSFMVFIIGSGMKKIAISDQQKSLT